MSTPARRLMMVVMALALLVALPGVAAGTDEPPPGTGTPGYWHKEDRWTGHLAEGVTVGGVDYTPAAAIAIINMPVKGDKRLTMFPALVAAHLNKAIGNPSGCIDQTLIDADLWWYLNHEEKVKANSDPWQDGGEHLYRMLDAYNNGHLCAPSRG